MDSKIIPIYPFRVSFYIVVRGKCGENFAHYGAVFAIEMLDNLFKMSRRIYVIIAEHRFSNGSIVAPPFQLLGKSILRADNAVIRI